MAIKVGTQNINEIAVDSTNAKLVTVGNTAVWNKFPQNLGSTLVSGNLKYIIDNNMLTSTSRSLGVHQLNLSMYMECVGVGWFNSYSATVESIFRIPHSGTTTGNTDFIVTMSCQDGGTSAPKITVSINTTEGSAGQVVTKTVSHSTSEDNPVFCSVDISIADSGTYVDNDFRVRYTIDCSDGKGGYTEESNYIDQKHGHLEKYKYTNALSYIAGPLIFAKVSDYSSLSNLSHVYYSIQSNQL